MSKVIHNHQNRRFEWNEDGFLGYAEYFEEGRALAVTHIIVAPELRGRGVASSLARAVVEFARANGFQIRPLCPFMSAYCERHPEISELVEN